MKRATEVKPIVPSVPTIAPLPSIPAAITFPSFPKIPQWDKEDVNDSDWEEEETPKPKKERKAKQGLSDEKIAFFIIMFLKNHIRAIVNIDGSEALTIKETLEIVSPEIKKKMLAFIKETLIKKRHQDLFEFWGITA